MRETIMVKRCGRIAMKAVVDVSFRSPAGDIDQAIRLPLFGCSRGDARYRRIELKHRAEFA
jgi:hypothetical protein